MKKSKINFDNLAFVDVETTGLSAHRGKVIEIGIIRVEKGKMVGKLDQLLDPEVPISPWITNLTGIQNEDLEDQPTFYGVAERVSELLEDAVFVAHCVDFDYSFIRAEMDRIGFPLELDRLCTRRLSRALYPEQRRHRVDDLMMVHGIRCERRHRAYDDALVLWEFWQKCSLSDQPELLKKLLKKPRRPSLRYEDL